MLNKNFKVIVDHDIEAMAKMIQRLETLGASVYEINDQIDYIILECRSKVWNIKKIEKALIAM